METQDWDIRAAEEEDEFSDVWMRGIAKEWAAELDDAREDIYTTEDGKPPDGRR